ncbi:MAG: hypothetical protein IPL88_09875 [Rhizobiales bacterium]|nr:hypothetical protein [Hyphomicrobiales bacterium]
MMSSAAGRRPAFAPARALALCALALALAGCVDTLAESKSAPPARQTIAAREGVSPRGAAVALVSVDGAPEEATQRFVTALKAESAAREIAFADAGKARYHVRGYLAAYPGADGVTISYVWDVFDAGKRRAQRMSDELTVKAGRSADPWAGLDETAYASLAGKSADDLAAFLSNTPEAIAAARSGAAPGAAPSAAAALSPGPKPAAALSYAPDE